MSRPLRNLENPLSDVMKKLRVQFLIVGVFSLFINLLMFVGPIYMLQVYDRVLTSRNEATLVALTVIAIGLLVVYALLEFTRSRLLVRIGIKFDLLLSGRLFKSIFALSANGQQKSSSQSMRDLSNIREFMTGAGILAFFDSPWVPLYVGVTFMLHFWLGVVTAIGTVLIFILALANEILTRKALQKASATTIQSSTYTDDGLRNAETVYAMGMIDGIASRWSNYHCKTMHLQAIASDRAGSVMAMSKFIRMALQIAILGVGASLALTGEISPGTMIAASIVMGRALQPVEIAVGQWKSFIAARNAYQRVGNVLARSATDFDKMALPKPKGALSFEKVVVFAPGTNVPILRGLTVSLPSGSITGIIGPSGSGKSTFARAATGIWPAANGNIRIDGNDISTWNMSELGPNIGYLPQDVELFSGTVAENIARFGDIDSAAVIDAAVMAGVDSLIKKLPDGYNTVIGPSGSGLSGGQRQRIALARAFYKLPPLIILDEPNANLDTEGEQALAMAIDRAKTNGQTLLVITHRKGLLKHVDNVVVLDNGNVATAGTMSDVIKTISTQRTTNDKLPNQQDKAM